MDCSFSAESRAARRADADANNFFVAMPYVLGHCGKPLPETLGAIAAGLALGGLALYHRSFWLGAISHWTIAMTMDLMALWRRGISIVIVSPCLTLLAQKCTNSRVRTSSASSTRTSPATC